MSNTASQNTVVYMGEESITETDIRYQSLLSFF